MIFRFTFYLALLLLAVSCADQGRITQGDPAVRCGAGANPLLGVRLFSFSFETSLYTRATIGKANDKIRTDAKNTAKPT